jgi:hypothetical protein
MFGRRHEKAPRPVPQWTREKMLALLVGAGVLGLVLLIGVGLCVYYALRPDPRSGAGGGNGTATTTSSSSPGSGNGGSSGSQDVRKAQDALAAKPMPQVDDAASHPSAVSTSSPGAPIVLPAATRVGPAGVPSGYPHTPEGAMAQLAAIDQVALQSGSLGTARAVITQWAMPGGPNAASWSGVQALSSLLTDTQTAGTAQLAIVFTPLMGQIKGTVGPDFVVPCIDFELDVTLTQTARGAVADCQRMVWQPDAKGGRWMVGPGAEPVTPPSVWPDTDLAISVGYRDLTKAS